MANSKSLLYADHIEITDKISVRIPTVGEILEDEQKYYSLVSSLTSSPFQCMVQLDDMGIDYTEVTDYQLFQMMFVMLSTTDMSILFGDLVTNGYQLYKDTSNNTDVL